MRRGYIIIAAVITMLICAGCSFGELEYDMNLGYDLNKVKSKDITFNVYHVNPEDHSWERIASFPCTPEPGHYNDVKIEGEKGKIKAVLSFVYFVLKNTSAPGCTYPVCHIGALQ